ncbi:MAG: hypothetical protein ACR2IR_02895 [Acidimicrobiia bacterium]
MVLASLVTEHLQRQGVACQVDMDLDQRFDCLPDSIDYPWMKREHVTDPHCVVGVGMRPASKPGHHNDRRMVTYWRALLVG